MKKYLAAGLAVALSLIGFAPSVALADGAFIEGRVGRSDLDSLGYNESDNAFAINGGYRWGSFGVEGGYVDLGQVDQLYYLSPTFHSRGSTELSGWTLGGNGHFNLNDHWYLSARAGLFHWKADYRYLDSDGTRGAGDITDTDWYAGVGVGYDINANWGVGLNYDYFKVGAGSSNNVDKLSISTEYRF
ncbi:outer membrane protein [Tahibacter amnicola]|uniref:Porin family protein n=1 Tax=Tahibacter amnicola TaxID=2976241 RepID=A0ABY6BM67_9GAMM|nr:porin family protein [Tahibacter amnicola]UXI69490.1 porin family protein [Tahibacter amnicola]